MREKAIRDELIPSADPAAVVAQYEPLIKKVARQYISILERSGAVGLEDLHQVARMVILRAQRTYIPGNASFFTFIYKPIHWAIRRALGFDNRTGAAPPWLVYLDEPLPGLEAEEITRLDTLVDPEAVPMDEPIIEDETRRENPAEVRAAVDRLKSERQREIIRRVYFDGETRQAAAKDLLVLTSLPAEIRQAVADGMASVNIVINEGAVSAIGECVSVGWGGKVQAMTK